MEWLDREQHPPEDGLILCYGEGEVFVCESIETKWGRRYIPIKENFKEWNYWIPIPTLPKKEEASDEERP